jgi:hypothetical protein
LAGQGGSNGGKLDAPSFQALATAAGGVDEVARYCQGGVTSPGIGEATDPPGGGPAHSNAHSQRGVNQSGGPPARKGPPPAALRGLCHAYLAGKGGGKDGKLDATAFQTLTAAAGGADRVSTYCAALLR